MIFTFLHKKTSKTNGILINSNSSHLRSNLMRCSRMKLFSIYILFIIFCISLVQANDKSDENNRYSNSDHRHHHVHQVHHNHRQHFKNHYSHNHDMINSDKNLQSLNESIPNTSNINLDRRKAFNNTNNKILNRPLRLSLTTSNNLQSNLFKRNSNVNTINRTGSNFMESHNDKKNIEINDRLNSKSLTNINSGYKTYNSVSNQDDSKDDVLHDVEIIQRRWNDGNSEVFTPPTITTTTTTAPTTITSKGKTFHKINDGRHICVQHKTVQIPVKTREIYSRPTWRHVSEPCEENQICTRVQLVHEPVYRDIVRHKSTRQITYECCPGWQPTIKNANSCLKPVCKVKCKNGGTCIKPDTCSCPQGFTGKYCEQDINECKNEKPCDQLCYNTEGSYYCQCRDGFVLMSDKQSCKKINGVTNDDAFEARDLENDVDNTDILSTRIEKLEKMMANERMTTNDLYKNFQATSHLVDSLKTRLSTLEKQQQDISHLQDKLLSNDAKTKTLEYLVNILLKCQKNPISCQQI